MNAPDEMALDAALVCDALIDVLSEQHAQLVIRAERIREDATHEEARPENDKDTRATEQSYLARGQTMRTEALAEALGRVRALRLVLPRGGEGATIAPGHVVHAEVSTDDDAHERWFFVAPGAGGTELHCDGRTVLVLSPKAPVARALMGRAAGEAFELVVAGEPREYEVLAVCGARAG